MNIQSSVFRIVQFTDLHLGERDDAVVLQLLRRVFTTERPDFAVFTGDQVAGYAVFHRTNDLWLKALSVASEFGVPFATVFGNHDDQPFMMDPLLWHRWAVPGFFVALVLCVLVMCRTRMGKWLMAPVLIFLVISIATFPNHRLRRNLYELERETYPRLSYTVAEGARLDTVAEGARLLVRGPNGSVALYFLDTGGGCIPEGITKDQLDWLQGFAALPSLAFMHIPPFGDGIFNASVCQGPPPREPTSRCPGSETLLETLASIGTLAVFVGHDHDNSWCCPSGSMMLCYGRHAGGYGTLTPGARIIDVRLEGKVTVETRVVE